MAARFVYDECKAFFSSGIFYIALGCAFLWISYTIANEAHSAFVFLLAVLGIAVVLYGTGTQAVGSGNSGPINIAIAGGAGVLAALFGFGVVKYHGDIDEVFKRTQDYGVLELYVDEKGSTAVTADLVEFDVRAQIEDAAPLPLYHDSRRIRILVPILDEEEVTQVVVTLRSKSNLADIQNNSEFPIAIHWKDEAVSRRSGLNNEVVPKLTKPLTLISAAVQVSPLTEANRDSESFTVSPK